MSAVKDLIRIDPVSAVNSVQKILDRIPRGQKRRAKADFRGSQDTVRAVAGLTCELVRPPSLKVE